MRAFVVALAVGLAVAAPAGAVKPAALPPAYWAKRADEVRARIARAETTLRRIRRNHRAALVVRGHGRDAVWLASLVVWGPIKGPGAFRVARCESGTSGWTRAVSPWGHRTAWQLSPDWVRRLGFDDDALGQARDAHWIWEQDGGTFERQWACAWAAR